MSSENTDAETLHDIATLLGPTWVDPDGDVLAGVERLRGAHAKAVEVNEGLHFSVKTLNATVDRLLAEKAQREAPLITENGKLREALNLAKNGDLSDPVVRARFDELLAEVRR